VKRWRTTTGRVIAGRATPGCDAAGVDTPADLAADLELALALADAADAVTLPRFRAADLRVDRKPDRTPVTDADTAAEAALRALIAERRPGDEVLGEEEGGELSAEGRGWVLDPIDGTKNFSRGMPAWGTLIALTVAGEPVVGVASAPALGRRWWGAPGLGAWTSDGPGADPRRIAVSAVAELSDAYLSTTDLRIFGHQGRMDRWLALVDACWETRAFGDFWQYCLVAEGVLDVAVDPVANAWDLAALVPIVAEAGGRMTGLAGTGSFAEGDGIATNGLLHDPALALIGTGS
jgi:histidinol-phosphatase